MGLDPIILHQSFIIPVTIIWYSKSCNNKTKKQKKLFVNKSLVNCLLKWLHCIFVEEYSGCTVAWQNVIDLLLFG